MSIDKGTRKTVLQVKEACTKIGERWTPNLRRVWRPFALAAQGSINVTSTSPGTERGRERWQVLDLFCGCGGMSLGFAAVGRLVPSFRVIGGCDIDEEATATFAANLGAPGIVADVRELVDTKRNLAAFLRRLHGYDSSKPLVLIGCAPCQGFSAHRKKNWHKDDSRNDLVSEVARLASTLRPACVIMENVPELLSRKYWDHFENFKGILAERGYSIKQAIYNAAAFGVPQERYRAVVIAMQSEFLLPRPMFEQRSYVTVREAIGHLPVVGPGEAPPTDRLHRSARHRESTLDVIRRVPKNGGSRPFGVGPQCLDKVKGFYDVYGRLNWDRPAITITHYARNPASGRYVHPEQDRGLTAREAAVLQSFPAHYEFKGSFDSIFRQIGEAVPPKFSAAIAAMVLIEMLAGPPGDSDVRKGVKSLERPVSSSFSSVIAGRKLAGVSHGVYVH